MEIKSKPILRWPGGKTQLLSDIQMLLPQEYRGFHEPFAGGGALTFALQPLGGYLSDLNPELINFYRVLKQKPQVLAGHLSNLRIEDKHFYDLRAKDRHHAFLKLCPVWRAARFLFINRTCFNGVMRVNRMGQLNCSYGSPIVAARVFNTDSIMAASLALKGVRIYEGSYECVEGKAEEGDFVYFDPPYVSVRPAGTIGYTERGFGLNDQAQLARFCGKLTKKGVYWMMSNANVPFIKRLLGHYNVHEVSARRSLSGCAASRGKITELLVTNYWLRIIDYETISLFSILLDDDCFARLCGGAGR